MTTRYKTQAFIFGKNDVNEFDRIFSVFTDEFGRLDIFAKAIRKGVSKLRSGIDTFYFSEIEFIQGKRRKTLTDAVIIEKLKNIGKNPLKFKIGHNIGEILSSFIIGEERDKDIFKLLKETFDRLDKENLTDRQCARLEYYFLWNIISLLGYRPEVEKCSVCNNKLNPESIYFSNKSGGAVCKKCLSDDLKVLIINSDAVKLLRLIFKKEWPLFCKIKISGPSQKLFKKISDSYYFYTLSDNSSKNILMRKAE